MKKKFLFTTKTLVAMLLLLVSSPALRAQATYLYEGFNAVTPTGWSNINNSSPKSNRKWEQGDADGFFTALSGDSSSYAETDFSDISPDQSGIISTWLITPLLSLKNGAVLTFYTRTADVVTPPEFPDRLQVRLSLNGTSADVGASSTDVGDYTTLLLDINPQQSPNVYPQTWTAYKVMLSNIPANATGRIAFRYFVTDGGATGNNSTYIGLDEVNYNIDALPVNLISFKGALKNNAAMLNWNTATEINNTGFDVERSTDGHNFYKIGFVAANVNGAAGAAYQYTDAKVSEGTNYYRLKQMDKDGGYQYSSVVNIDYHSFSWLVKGYPGSMQLLLQLDKQAKVAVEIIAANGAVLHTINRGELNAGSYTIPVPNTVVKGIYIIDLKVNDKSYNKKILL